MSNEKNGLGDMSQSGTLEGFAPEYFGEDKEWHLIPYKEDANGVPCPLWSNNQLSMSGKLGYEQAQTIRWAFLANALATTFIRPETRIGRYKITYSIKAEFDAHLAEVGDHD